MGISTDEQETVINFGRNDETVTCWTSDSTWMTKMDKLIEKNPEEFKCTKEETIDGQVVQKRYVFPKKYTTIRSKTKKISMTEEQKRAASERMKKLRAEQLAQNQK